MEAARITVLAPAKINLFLGVGEVLPDGYHAVTTVLHTLELHDELVMTEADSLSLTCEHDLGIECERNLAWRAAEAMGVAFGRQSAVTIELHKHVPHGAGLGGGSSDAASVVAGLATLWGAEPLDPRCVRVAASLGADVPFFLGRTGCALMTGRGDVFDRELTALPGLPVVVVKPPQPVPTAAAYAQFDANPQPVGDPSAVIEALERADAGALVSAVANNMEPAACTLVQDVRQVRDWLTGSDGVAGALVAGSGSAVVGFCDSGKRAEEIAERAKQRGWWAVPTRTGGSGVSIERRACE